MSPLDKDPMNDFRIDTYGGGRVNITHLPSGHWGGGPCRMLAWVRLRDSLFDSAIIVTKWPNEAIEAFTADRETSSIKDPPGGIAVEKPYPGILLPVRNLAKGYNDGNTTIGHVSITKELAQKIVDLAGPRNEDDIGDPTPQKVRLPKIRTIFTSDEFKHGWKECERTMIIALREAGIEIE